MATGDIYGSAASLAPLGRAQLVRVDDDDDEPKTWAVELVAEGPARFELVAGAGQASRSFSVWLSGGSTTVAVVASALQVSAVSEAPSGPRFGVQAFAAPGVAPDRAPDVARGFPVTGPVDLPASGRLFAWLHNQGVTGARVMLAGVRLADIAPGATFKLEWSGAFRVELGSVNVIEVWRS